MLAVEELDQRPRANRRFTWTTSGPGPPPQVADHGSVVGGEHSVDRGSGEGRRLGVDGPIRAIVDLTVEPLTDSRSGLTIAVDFEGHGIGKVLVPLIVRREARAEMPTNLAALKNRTKKP